MTLHDGSTVHADSAAEILEELIPAFTSLTESDQQAARRRLAVQLASASQEVRVRAARANGVLDDGQDSAALVDVLRADKALSMRLSTEDAPDEPADWLGEPALVLVATQYSPHADYPRIGGNVAYIDPSSDAALLTSLREAGVFDYWTASSQRP